MLTYKGRYLNDEGNKLILSKLLSPGVQYRPL